MSGIDLQIGDLGGTTLGLAAGHTIWLDDNAAGWGWFVDATPRSDTEYLLSGNQGEQHRVDLLTVVMHEMGHLLGYDHDTGGLMAETLATGHVAPQCRTITRQRWTTCSTNPSTFAGRLVRYLADRTIGTAAAVGQASQITANRTISHPFLLAKELCHVRFSSHEEPRTSDFPIPSKTTCAMFAPTNPCAASANGTVEDRRLLAFVGPNDNGWAFSIEASNNQTVVNDVSFDNFGNSLISGNFAGTVNFDPRGEVPATDSIRTSVFANDNYTDDGFLASLRPRREIQLGEGRGRWDRARSVHWRGNRRRWKHLRHRELLAFGQRRWRYLIWRRNLGLSR